MRDLITIQARTPATDTVWGSDGAAGDSWATFAQVWASVTAISAAEQFEPATNEPGIGVQSRVTHEVEMHWLAGVTNQHRIIWRGLALDIVSVIDPDSRRRRLAISAVAHLPATP